MNIRKGLAAAAAVLLTMPLAVGKAQETAQGNNIPAVYGTPVTETASLSDETGTLQLTVDALTGTVRVVDARTGKTWMSNVDRPEEDPLAYGVNNENVRSQLLIRYNGGGSNLQDASFVQCREKGEGELQVFQTPECITVLYRFTAIGITVPLQYRLEGRILTASVPGSGVEETGDNALVGFSILPFLGAGGPEEEGYMLLPDGAGALVYFNNGKTGEGRLELEALYGDRTKPLEAPREETQPVLLPGFGFCHETSAAGLFCYASEGAHGGTITANVAGRETSFNYAYYTFLYRSYDTVVQMKNTYMSKAKLIHDEQHTGADAYTMRYVFLEPGNSGLGGMAAACRTLLYGEREALEAGTPPLLVDLYMGVRVRTNFLGIPYDTLRPLTTFAQAEEMAEAFRQGGVESSVFRLLGFDSDGAFGGRKKESLEVASSLGGEKGLLSLQSQPGVSVYPEVELLSYNRGGGLLQSNRMAFDLLYEGIEQSVFTVASGMPTEDPPFKLIKASAIEKAARTLSASLDKAGVKGISSSGLGYAPYADFSRAAPYRLEQTAAAMQQAAEVLTEKHSLMLSAPTADRMPLADVLHNLPVRSSGYPLEDTDVPFLAMVLSGYVVYGGENINLLGDKQEGLLRAIETGSGLSAALMWEDYAKIKKTGLHALYACQYAEQADWIMEQYRELKEALREVWGTPMVDVTVISGEARAMRYADGTQVAVNYGKAPVTWNGQTIPARGYRVYSGGAAG